MDGWIDCLIRAVGTRKARVNVVYLNRPSSVLAWGLSRVVFSFVWQRDFYSPRQFSCDVLHCNGSASRVWNDWPRSSLSEKVCQCTQRTFSANLYISFVRHTHSPRDKSTMVSKKPVRSYFAHLCYDSNENRTTL